MILKHAIQVAREYDEAREAMKEAIARFERARQAYEALPLSFQVQEPNGIAHHQHTGRGPS